MAFTLVAIGVVATGGVEALGNSERGPRMLEHLRPRQTEHSPPIRVDVDMTLVPVTVVDPLGRCVLGLDASNFSLMEEREEYEIASFSQEDAPVSVGIVFDRSGSMEPNMTTARRAVTALTRQLNPEDQAMLVTVAKRPHVRFRMTPNFEKFSGELMFSKAGGTTALVDGVYLALNRVRRARTLRKAVIVISDGIDNSSRYTESELFSFASEAGAQVYSIGVRREHPDSIDWQGLGFLNELASRTGGRFFEIGSPAALVDAMARIGVTLHNQYVLGFYPPSDAPAGKYRRIKVNLRVPEGIPRLSVYARTGYYTPY